MWTAHSGLSPGQDLSPRAGAAVPAGLWLAQLGSRAHPSTNHCGQERRRRHWSSRNHVVGAESALQQ